MKLLFTLIGLASAGFGPMPLYNSIEGNTYNLNGYTINPYLNVQYQNTSYGSFNTYVAENGVYTYQYYTGGSSAGCTAARSMKLFVDCGNSVSLGPVSEPTACNYQGVLEMPQACSVSFAVGNENPSVTPSPRNATASAASSSSNNDGLIGLILGALGVTGVAGVIAIQVYNSMKNKGGLSRLFKSNIAQVDKVMNKLPVSEGMKKSIKSIAEKQIDKLDAEIDKKLKTTRSKIAEAEGRMDEEEYKEEVPPVQRTKRQSFVDLDSEPKRSMSRSTTPAPTRIISRSTTPAPTRELSPESRKVVSRPLTPPTEIAVSSDEILKPEKVEINASDLEEFKRFLVFKSQSSALSQ